MLFLSSYLIIPVIVSLSIDFPLTDNAILQRSFVLSEQVYISGLADSSAEVIQLSLSTSLGSFSMLTKATDYVYTFKFDVPTKIQYGISNLEVKGQTNRILLKNITFGDVYECEIDGRRQKTLFKTFNVIDRLILKFIRVFYEDKWQQLTPSISQHFSPVCISSAINLAKLSESQTVFIGLIDRNQVLVDNIKYISRYVTRSLIISKIGTQSLANKLDELIAKERITKGVGDFPVVVISPLVFDTSASDYAKIRSSLYDLKEQNAGIVESYDLNHSSADVIELGRRVALKITRMALPYTASRHFSLGPMPVSILFDNGILIVQMNKQSTNGFKVVNTHNTGICDFFQWRENLSKEWKTLQNININYGTLEKIVLKLPLGSQPDRLRYNWYNGPICFWKNRYGLVARSFDKPIQDLTTSSFGYQNNISIDIISAPVMGFNPWNYYHCNIDENEILLTAKKIKMLGLFDVGYRYINIDDCWQRSRSENGTIVEDLLKFPRGIKPLVKDLHRMGFKVGLYTSSTSLTCQYRPGSYMYEEVDAKTYCEDYDIDFIKIDNCFGSQYEDPSESWIKFAQSFRRFCKHKILVSVEYCSSLSGCGETIDKVANMWRTTADSSPSWTSLYSNIHENNNLAQLAKPGHYNDPDMLEVGNKGLSFFEQRTQFTLWCLVSAPLLVGTNLNKISTDEINILTNLNAITINQDPGYLNRTQGILIETVCVNESIRTSRKLSNCNRLEVWRKILSSGEIALAIVNLENKNIKYTLELLPFIGKKQKIRELWSNLDYESTIQASLRSHDSHLFLTQP